MLIIEYRLADPETHSDTPLNNDNGLSISNLSIGFVTAKFINNTASFEPPTNLEKPIIPIDPSLQSGNNGGK